MRTLLRQAVVLLATLLVSSGRANHTLCSRIDRCVENHSSAYASSYCSSYVSVTTYTTTVSGATTTSTITSFTATSTRTTNADACYHGTSTFSANKRAVTVTPDADAVKTHSKPFCLRDYTQTAALSRACDCLVTTPTVTVTANPSTSFTTLLTSTTVASTLPQYFSLIWPATFSNGIEQNWNGVITDSPNERLVAFDSPSENIPSAQFTFDTYSDTDCILVDSSGNVGRDNGKGARVVTFPTAAGPSFDGTPLPCSVYSGDVLHCQLGDDSYLGFIGYMPPPYFLRLDSVGSGTTILVEPVSS